MAESNTYVDDGYYADEFDDPTRNVFIEPEKRALIRTEDVYQTDPEVGTIGYSETLLSVVANYRNSGRPEGFNAQCMVGKSKRGEVALRLFAVIDPDTRTFVRAGFQTRGCLAVTACASMICMMIEGKTFDEALAISADDVANALDGVPWDKSYTPNFATCGVKALIGDFMIRQGAPLAEVERAAHCDDGSVACLLCENCSLRTSRTELAIEEAERDAAGVQEEAAAEADPASEGPQDSDAPDASPELLEHNALAEVFDMVRADSRKGLLSTPGRWEAAGLVPPHMNGEDLEMLVYDYLEPLLAERKAKAPAKAAPKPKPKGRPVGVPRWFDKSGGADAGDAEAGQGAGAAAAAAADEGAPSKAPKVSAAAPKREEVAKPRDEVFGSLNIPEGYRLVERDGQVVLVETDEKDPVRELEVNDENIELLMGAYGYYLYDSELMTRAFARWAFLAAEGNDEATFAELVREESRIYPRPMPLVSLQNRPFSKTPGEIEAIWETVHSSGLYPDLERIEASDGTVFFYSSEFLGATRAQSIAEWNAVERELNM